MIVSIIKCKSKDWKEHFKKEFGAYPPNATLQDVANDKVSMYGNHVDAFIKEKKKEPKKTVPPQKAVRQEYTQGKGAVGKIVPFETKKKGFGF